MTSSDAGPDLENNTTINNNTNSNNTNPHKPPTVFNSLKVILFSSWINVLIIFIPLGYIANGLSWSDTAVFVLNFLAIIPLAKLLGFATEDISLRVGQVRFTLS